MKVLMIVTKLNIGGTETYVLSLAQALCQKGVQVGIATSGGPLVARCKQLRIPVHAIPAAVINSPSAYAASLATLLRSHAYNLVHAHDPRSFRAICALRRVSSVPAVVTLHGTYFPKPLIRSVASHANIFIAVSPALSKWVQRCGVPSGRIIVIPNGIDTAHFSPTPTTTTAQARSLLDLPQRGMLIAYAGRFSSDKFPIAQKIIQAGERLNRLFPDITTVLVGPGVYRSTLAELAAQANKRLGRRAIIVRPALANVRTLYHAADLVIGTGRVALEAMACGKPVLAAGVKGYLGLVTPERIGHAIHCHFGDHAADEPLTVEHLVRDSTRIRKTPELTQSLSKFGRHLVVSRFSISPIANQLIAVYKDCHPMKSTSRNDRSISKINLKPRFRLKPSQKQQHVAQNRSSTRSQITFPKMFTRSNLKSN
ncbi:MAG: glycosyltransferase, partial [Tumebacillaceae bacterium]